MWGVCRAFSMLFFFFQAEDGIRDYKVTGVQTCALPICNSALAITTTPSSTSTGGTAAARSGRRSPSTSSAWSSTTWNRTIQLRLPRSRSEEHTSQLQSPCNLVGRLLLDKKLDVA